MAIALRSSSNAGTSGSGATSLTVPVPSGATAGDVLFLSLSATKYASLGGGGAQSAPFAVSPPGGSTWSQITAPITTNRDTFDVPEVLWTFWKVVQAGDPSSYAFSLSDGSGGLATAAASMSCWMGSIGSIRITANAQASAGSTLTSAAVAAVSNDMTVILAGGGGNAGYYTSGPDSVNAMGITMPSTGGWSAAPTSGIGSASGSGQHNPQIAGFSYQTGATGTASITYSGNLFSSWVQNIAKIEETSTFSGSAYSFSVANNVASVDNQLVLVAGMRVAATPSVTITDTQGNTWAVQNTYEEANNATILASTTMNVAPLTTADSITITFSGTGFTSGPNIYVDEYGGLLESAGALVADSISDNWLSSGTSWPVGASCDPTVVGDVVIATGLWATGSAVSLAVSGTTTTGGTWQPFNVGVQINNTSDTSYPKSLFYARKHLGTTTATGSVGTVQEYKTSVASATSIAGFGAALKGSGAYNMAAVTVALQAGTTPINDTDIGTFADTASTVLVQSSDTWSGDDEANVGYTALASDTWSGSETGRSQVPINTSETGTFVDTAVVKAAVPTSDTGTFSSTLNVENPATGAIFAFGADVANQAVDNATAALATTVSDSWALQNEAATIAVQGPLPAGTQRVIHVLPEVADDIVSGSSTELPATD